MNGKREKTNAHGAGRILSYEPLKVHCDACDQDFNSWESFGRHVDEIVDKPADTRREAVMDVLADHLGDTSHTRRVHQMRIPRRIPGHHRMARAPRPSHHRQH